MRHVPAGNTWHPARDQLTGTEAYGTPCGGQCAEAWSTRWEASKVGAFLFATGDCSKWLVAESSEVTGGWYANQPRQVMASSLNTDAHKVRWYRRSRNKEDPWISLTDHGPAIGQGNHWS